MKTLRFNVGCMSFFGRVKRSEAPALAVNTKNSDVFASVFPELNSHQAKSVVVAGSPLILHIEVLRHVAEIAEAVIRSIAIDVVNIIAGPFARHVQPRQAVRGVGLGVDHQVQVTGLVGPATSGICAPDKSGKQASCRVVPDKALKALSGHLVCVHT